MTKLIDLPDYAARIDTDIDWNGAGVYTWLGPVPDCAHCGEPLADERGRARIDYLPTLDHIVVCPRCDTYGGRA